MTLINTAINEETQELEITFPEVGNDTNNTDVCAIQESSSPPPPQQQQEENPKATTTTPTKSTTITVPLHPDETYLSQNCEKLHVEIWEYNTDAYAYTSPIITSAVTKFFTSLDPSKSSSSSSSSIKLVMKGPTPRPAQGNGHQTHLGRLESVNFPDVLPILVATEESLTELNTRLTTNSHSAITIERFRPNIILKSSPSASSPVHPWEEDEWRTLRLNPPQSTTASFLNSFTPAFLSSSIDMDVSARCARCQVPNVNPDTGVKNPKQPWDMLVSYRRVDEGIKYKPCFGMLCCPRSEGEVDVGMDVQVLEVMQAAGGKGMHRYIKGF